jgi:hypothetical protein
VSARRVRAKGCEAPSVALDVEDWEPRFARWVEPAWRNFLELSGARLFAVFPVEIEQQVTDGDVSFDRAGGRRRPSMVASAARSIAV